MKMFLAGLTLLLSTTAFAGAAVSYSCLGKDKTSGDSVSFQLLFSDQGPKGYTNDSITITKKGAETLTSPLTFQMYGATKKNNCQRNSEGEIELVNDLAMTPTKDGDIAAYTVSIKSECQDLKLDVQAYCLFE